MTASRTPEPSPTLESIPPEVLGHIAYFVATSQLKGPPSDLASLCRTSKSVHASLSFSDNPALYGAIFRFKFDVTAPLRRLGPEYTSAPCLAAELRRRFQGMKRIRAGVGSRLSEDPSPEQDLLMAVFLMLENDGKNTVQLKHFALVEQWLHEFFIGHSGGSYASNDMYSKNWPRDNEENKWAMWLLWLCDSDGTSLNYSTTVRRMYCDVLRAYALGANKYPLTQNSWTDFSHSCVPESTGRQPYLHYNLPLKPVAPPISISAILGYISRMTDPVPTFSSMSPETQFPGIDAIPTSLPDQEQLDTASSTDVSFSRRWDCDWERCIHPSFLERSVHRLDRCYHPGALEGAWEGLFTYTEFSVYAALLSGGPPQVLHDGAIGQNLQVWKLREYNLYSSEPSEPSLDPLQGRLPPGEALHAFFPHTIFKEKEDSVVFTHGSREITYIRALPSANGNAETNHKMLLDVVVLGEGHSSWGDFKLRGRVRSSDAFVTILKEYNGADDRGRWLYRGYLVGGRLAGRWRDVQSPLRLDGYEGGFELSQRV